MTKQKLLRELKEVARELAGITTDDDCVINRIDGASGTLWWLIGQIEDVKSIECDDEDDGK